MTDPAYQKHPLTLVLALGVILAALVGAFYMMRQADARMETADVNTIEAPIPVDVVVVGRGDLARIIEARGFLSGIEEITVHAETTGRVLSRAVEDGGHVEAGDVLLVIDQTFHELHVQQAQAELRRAVAQVEESRAALKQMRAQLAMAEAVHANRADEMERINNLHSSGHSPEIEYDRTVTALRTSDAELAAANAALARTSEQQVVAEAVVAVAEAAVNEAKAHLERCVVRAPVSGRVNRFFIEPGEYVVATVPLVEVIRLDRMKMVVELADTVIPLLRSFHGAEIIADADTGRSHAASLDHVAPKMDPMSRKFQVELRVENADEALLSGMYGQAVIRCGELRDVMRIPRQAVFKHFGADSCLVVRGEAGAQRAELRRVEVENIQGRLDDLRVLSGLDEGDRLIVSKRRDLRDGSRVDVTEVLAVGAMAAP